MKTKRFLSIVLTLAMLVGMFPGMSLNASAAGNTTEITSTNTSGTMTITLTIKAAQTITASDVTATYGDTNKSVTASVTTPATGGGAISYTVKDGSGDYIDVASDGKLTIKKVPVSGKAYVIVKAAETDDYAETTKEVTVTISKAEATVAAKDQGIMVGGTVPDLFVPVLNTHYSVTGLVGTDALTTAPTLAYQKNGSAATPDNTTAGTYDIVPSGASAGDNYNISYTNGTLTITAKDAQTITASDVTATYGETDKSVSATTDGNGEISYAVKAGSEDYISVASDGKLTIKKVPADGKAYVTVTASETNTGGIDGNGYVAATKDVTVNISKAIVTITAKDQSIYVGGTVPTLSGADFYTVSGLVGEDALTTNPTLAFQNNGSAATPDNTTAGTYDIVPSGASAGDNYNISYTNGTLTITARNTQTITASDVTATYGDTDKSVSATTDGNGEISYTVKAGSENYIDVNTSTGALTIKAVPADGKAYVTVKATETTTGGTGDKGYAAATKDVTVNISKATVTITAKDQSIYVGDTVPTLSGTDFYTVTGLVGEETLTTAPTLAYQKNGEAATPDSATADTYDIVPSGAATSDNYSISYTNGTLTISNKGTQTISSENVTATYGDTDKSVSATVTDPATGGGDISYAVKEGSGDYIEINASTGALTIKAVPADGKAYVIVTAAETSTYTQATKEVTVTINKANAVAATVTANNRTYNGTEKPLVTVTGEATGGEMQYALGTDDKTAPTKDWNEAIPAGTDAGTYYVWYKVKADENHKDTDANYVEVSIGKRSVTLTSATASKTYDGTALKNSDVIVSGDGFVTGEGATCNVTGSQILPGNSKNTFDYTLKSGTTAGNYEITKTEGTLTVTDRTDEEGDDKKYEITVTANSNEFTYDGTEHSVSGFVQTAFTFNGVTYTVSGLTATAKGTDVGSYTAEVTGTAVVKDANDNNLTNQFIVSTSNGTLTINKRNVTLTSATASKIYDGNALTDNTVSTAGDGFATGEGATYSVTGSQKVVGSSANAFTYTLNSGTKEANYNITKTEGTLTVTSRDAKYQISPQANSDELKYDGQSHEVTGFETDTFTVEGNTYTVSGLTAEGSGTDAGSYTVSVSGTAVVKDSDGNDVSDEFAVTPQTGTLTINKRSVTLTSASDEKEYDGDALTNDEVTVTSDGFVTGEGATYDVTGTRTLVGSSENAFTYTLNEGTKADNYDITPSYGTLTVTNRNTKYEVTLKANSGTEKYDGSEKTVSGYTIDGTAGEGTGESVVTSFTASNGKTYTVTGMSAEVTGTNAGEYTVNVTGTPAVKDADGNDVTAQFAVSSESGKLTIDKRSVTLTSATDTKVYDGKALSNDEITVSEDGFAEGEGATYDVTGSQTLAGESANAFTYALSVGTIADNYDITTVEGKLTVTKSDSSGEVTAVSGLVYDGKAKALVTAGKTEGGTLMYRLGTDGKWQQDIPEATDAGTYKIYYYIKGDDNHKDDGSEKEPKGSVETTIKKAAQDKPVETFAVAEASDDKTADGKISGFDKTKTYQYSADDGKTWTDVKAGSTEIAVKSGTYQIRYAEDKNHEAGKAASVTVTAKAAPEPIKKDATINLKSVNQKNNKVQISWTKVNEADGYDVYIHYCGSKAKKAAKTIKGNSTTSASFKKIDGKKINQKKNFHVKVVAYKMVDGKKVTLAKTITGHLAGAKSVKYTNPKALKLTKSTYNIKVKKTAKIKAKVTLENSKKKLLPKSHAAKLRYKSSNTKIATVDKNGKITGKSKGTCYIYVYTVNGLMKKAKVTVR